MRDDFLFLRRCDRLAIALALGLSAGACSSGGTTAPTAAVPSAQPTSPYAGLTDKISSFFSRSSATSQQGVAGSPQQDLDCPLIDIRSGASTLQIPPATEDQNSTMALKYQGTFVRAARECALVSGQMVMKVGIEGRIIIGPAGGPGQVDVPLRIAVVDETTAGTKPIVTKFIREPVTIGDGVGAVPFTHVEEGLTFPMPTADQLDHYIVYIGFDPLTAQAQEQQKQRPAIRSKTKLKTKPTAPAG